jgi:hypothetical protein
MACTSVFDVPNAVVAEMTITLLRTAASVTAATSSSSVVTCTPLLNEYAHQQVVITKTKHKQGKTHE